MSFSTAIAVTTVTNSSLALSKAEDNECAIIISNFQSMKQPNVEHMQHYAQCVDRLYPTAEREESEKQALQVCLIFTVLLVVVSLVIARWKDKDMEESVWFCFIFTMLGWLSALIAGMFAHAFL